LNRRLGGAQNLSGRFDKDKLSCPPKVFEPRTFHPVKWGIPKKKTNKQTATTAHNMKPEVPKAVTK